MDSDDEYETYLRQSRGTYQMNLEYEDETGACRFCGWHCEFQQNHVDHCARWKRCKHIDGVYIVTIDDIGEVACEERVPPAKVNDGSPPETRTVAPMWAQSLTS